jgi:hypothetical protein
MIDTDDIGPGAVLAVTLDGVDHTVTVVTFAGEQLTGTVESGEVVGFSTSDVVRVEKPKS